MPQNLGVNHPNNTPATTQTLSSSAGPVNILFSFINDADVLVFLGGTLRTNGTGNNNYTINTAKTQVTFNNTVSGDVIITRKSDLLNKVRTFTPGSSVRAADLNTQFDQVMQLIQDNYELLRGVVQNDSNDELTPGRTVLIKDDAVVTNSIEDGAVTTAKIANGTIINEDINASAQIDVNKLADGTSRQLLQTAANGNDVEWTSNVDVPGTLDVTGVATFDGNIDANGDLDVDGTTNLDNVDIDGTVHIQGTSTFVGQITASGGVSGDVTGNVTGNLTGNADTATNLAAAASVTNAEQAAHTASDTTYFTTAASDARYFNVSTGDTIKDGDAFPDNDTTIATTAAINDRIIDLVDNVGGFVPIANETSFPAENPDVNNGAGTIVSIAEIVTTRTPSSGTVTIANGQGSNTVTINNCGTTVLADGFGCLVETTTTLNTYNFHRLTPLATEVTTVAGNQANITTVANNIADVQTVAANNADIDTLAAIDADITTLAHIEDGTDATDAIQTVAGISANVTTVAGISANVTTVAGQTTEIGRLGTADAVADMNTLGTTAIVSDMDTLADIAADITTLAHIEDGTDSTDAIQTVATSINDVHNFADVYQINNGDPTQRADGTALQEGDLVYRSDTDVVRVYNGSAYSNITPDQSTINDITIVADDLASFEDLGSVADALVANQTGGALETCADNITDIRNLADIEDGTTATDAISNLAAIRTDVTACATRATEISRLGTTDVVADMALLGTTDCVADMAILGTTDVVADLNLLATNDVVADMALLANTDVIADMALLGTSDCVADMAILGTTDVVADLNTLATADIVADLETCSNNNANITTVANGIANVNTVAGRDTEIGRLGTADAVADMALLGTTDCVADMAILATTDVVADMNTLGTADIVADMNTLATAANVTAMDNCSDDIANINTVAGSIADVNRYANEYTIGTSQPGSPSSGDLWYDSNSGQNTLKYYDGSAWNSISAGISNLLSDTNPALGGNLDCNSRNLTEVGTVSGDDMAMDFGSVTDS